MLTSATLAEDSSVVVSGYSRGSYGAVNAGSADFVAVKLDPNGTVLWKWQVGVALGSDLEAPWEFRSSAMKLCLSPVSMAGADVSRRDK